jgi:hypothetical protein
MHRGDFVFPKLGVIMTSKERVKVSANRRITCTTSERCYYIVTDIIK